MAKLGLNLFSGKKEKEIRNYRDKFTISYEDENNLKKEDIGNLTKHFRLLYVLNPDIRGYYPQCKTAQDYAFRMVNKTQTYLWHSKRNGSNCATLCLLPYWADETDKINFTFTITRINEPKAKIFNETLCMAEVS